MYFNNANIYSTNCSVFFNHLISDAVFLDTASLNDPIKEIKHTGREPRTRDTASVILCGQVHRETKHETRHGELSEQISRRSRGSRAVPRLCFH
jgi:hypothetical protein